MRERYQQLIQWLGQHLDTPALTPLAGDASARQYYRVTTPNKTTQIVMDHPPEQGSCHPFVSLSHSLLAHGLPVPRVFAHSIEQGFVLLEDFGDCCFADCLNTTTAEQHYQAALDQLVHFHQCPAEPLGPFKALDAHLIEYELRGFDTWYLQQLLGLTLPQQVKQHLAKLTAWLTEELAKQPQVFMHRDFHCRNLMRQPNGNVGIIDFQDAMRGPITYDLASLLRDCYIDWPEALVTQLALYYKGLAEQHHLLPPTDNDCFLRWLDIASIERHLKAIFTFSRKAMQEGDNRYLCYLPRTLNYLNTLLPRYSELDGFTQWLREVTA